MFLGNRMSANCADCQVLRRYPSAGYECQNFRKAMGINIDNVILEKPLLSYCFHPYGTILVVGEEDES